MLSTIENVFIFGVIFPAVITIVVFLVFLFCWFKCDLREKILKRCLLKKRENSTASSNTSTNATRRIHYIKDTLDNQSSSTASGRGRHTSGESGSVHIQEPRSNHSNMGFEVDDFTYINGSNNMDTQIPSVHAAGPSGVVVKTNTRNTTLSDGIIQNVTDLVDKNYQNHGNNTATPSHVVLNMSNDNLIPGASKQYSCVSDNIRNSSINDCLNVNVVNGESVMRSTHSPVSQHYHNNTAGTNTPSGSYHSNTASPTQKYSNKTNTAPSVQKGSTHSRRAEYIQQVFRFPRHGQHHTTKLTSNHNAGISGSSLDNSTTSSNYSSGIDEGEGYHDYDGSAGSSGSSGGDNYGHFLPPTHPQYVKGTHSSINTISEGYSSRSHHFHPHHQINAYQPADIHSYHHRNKSTPATHSLHRNSDKYSDNLDLVYGQKLHRIQKSIVGSGSMKSSCSSVDSSGVNFVYDKDGIKIVENV